jgi:hypothetical protein
LNSESHNNEFHQIAGSDKRGKSFEEITSMIQWLKRAMLTAGLIGALALGGGALQVGAVALTAHVTHASHLEMAGECPGASVPCP